MQEVQKTLEDVVIYTTVALAAIPIMGVVVYGAGAAYSSVKSVGQKLLKNPSKFSELYYRNFQDFLTKPNFES
jgi:hypothetical protein